MAGAEVCSVYQSYGLGTVFEPGAPGFHSWIVCQWDMCEEVVLLVDRVLNRAVGFSEDSLLIDVLQTWEGSSCDVFGPHECDGSR